LGLRIEKVTMAEACLYRRPLGFLVDLSTRASRRASSEPRFPVDLEKDAVLIKGAPIQFRWEAHPARKKTERRKDTPTASSPKKKTEERGSWDPHRMGFGSVRQVVAIKSPPSVDGGAGVLWKIPLPRTRGEDRASEGGGEAHLSGDHNVKAFPPLSQRGKCDPGSPPPHIQLDSETPKNPRSGNDIA
jgi:hypothetical protein